MRQRTVGQRMYRIAWSSGFPYLTWAVVESVKKTCVMVELRDGTTERDSYWCESIGQAFDYAGTVLITENPFSNNHRHWTKTAVLAGRLHRLYRKWKQVKA